VKRWAYFDTSAVVKLYVDEPGSAEVQALAGRNRAVSSAILSVEIVSALARRNRSGELSDQAMEKALESFRKDLPLLDLVEVTADIRTRAEAALLSFPLRTLDAIHIASALFMREVLASPRLLFITSDRRQHAGASEAGLAVHLVPT
jgi:uncharacterized protein